MSTPKNSPISQDRSAFFAQDEWTKRLLQLFLDLVRRGAVAKKKEFSDYLEISPSFFNSIEKCEKNYPKELEKRTVVGLKLLREYGANPKFLEALSSEMYLREPVPKRNVQTMDEVPVNFYGHKKKLQLQQERDLYKARVEELEALVAQLEEELIKYRKAKPDKTPDIKTPKRRK